jgi:hypothetical protein
MVDAINRFLEHPKEKIANHIDELFGTKECFDVAMRARDRIGALRDIYQRQLENVAKFVRYFEMRDANNRVQYLLFFASNHPMGHLKMKEAMWAVDTNGQFRFSDATNSLQAVLFEADYAPMLWNIIHAEFAGKEVRTERILRFVNDETAFLEKHMKATLKEHLDAVSESERILVRPVKADGKNWRHGTFPPGVFVRFPGS